MDAKQGYCEMDLLQGSDKIYYGNLPKNQDNDYVKRKDLYPTTVLRVYRLMTNYRQLRPQGRYLWGGGGGRSKL